ncbi:hypothetical protein ILUMI_06634 [Ignelater luminosus]|uniref:Endonuclease/exonuclease/phosphatase domain-containing protein n=1 Tax=Ignelater luminosus TaxID=2038154 RepID=A0A8K0D9V6_IGNLU|nr:hypothetical protein ILUMI_06634 [Ignelater luminosus]
MTRNLDRLRKPIIIGGDMNAKSTVWGSSHEDARGGIILNWSLTSNMVIINKGKTPTFVRDEQKSFIDIILGSDTIAENIRDWTVAEDEENFSLHRNIYYQFVNDNQQIVNNNNMQIWRIKESKIPELRRTLNGKLPTLGNTPSIANYVKTIQDVCKKVLTNKRTDTSNHQFTGRTRRLHRRGPLAFVQEGHIQEYIIT